MNKKKLTPLFSIILILTVFGLSNCESKSEYRILYGKLNNRVVDRGMGGCKQFTFYEFKGGGIVNPKNSQNKNLNMSERPTVYPRSKKHENYYYIHAGDSPVKEMHGYPVYDPTTREQILESADFKKMQPKTVKASDVNQFPSILVTSPDNKYLVYMMTKKEGRASFSSAKPFDKNSNLIVRDIKTGEEKIVVETNYNRALFHSFLDFSKDGDALFTIVREGEWFKFVKITLKTGEVEDFSKIFPSFDWNQINWSDFFEKRTSSYAFFALSPDETKLIAYKNHLTPSSGSTCFTTPDYKLLSLNIKENTIVTYSEEPGMIGTLKWRKGSQEFAFSVISANGCYPDYIDSTIYKMDRDGKDKDPLVTEKKSKILNLGWSPDEKEIGYSVYNNSFVSWIKTVNPEDKKVKEIISTKETEGKIDPKNPVTFIFSDWVAEK